MTQSVELLLDPSADDQIESQWDVLAAAGLPTERRTNPSASHRPHVTLAAVDTISDATDSALAAVAADLDLRVQIGSCLFFGPGRPGTGRFVLVRQVVASAELLDLQRRVAALTGVGEHPHFGSGRWTPHVTLAHRMSAEQAGQALSLLGGAPRVDVTITRCRRWDGVARRDWEL